MNPKENDVLRCICAEPCCRRNTVDIRSIGDVDSPLFVGMLLNLSRGNRDFEIGIADIPFAVLAIIDDELELWNERYVVWFKSDGKGCRILDGETDQHRKFESRSDMIDMLSVGMVTFDK